MKKGELNQTFILEGSPSVLQILLFKGDSIVINPSTVAYSSGNLKFISYPKSFPFNIPKERLDVIESPYSTLLNDKLESQYVGLVIASNGMQKPKDIIKIDLNLHDKVAFRAKNFLCASNQLLISKFAHFDTPLRFNYFSNDFFHSASKLEDQSNKILKQINFVYLQSFGTLIEKRLGINEEFSAHYEYVLCFEESVVVDKQRKENMVTLRGPGLVILDVKATKVYQAYTRMYAVLFALIAFLSILGEILLNINIEF